MQLDFPAQSDGDLRAEWGVRDGIYCAAVHGEDCHVSVSEGSVYFLFFFFREVLGELVRAGSAC